MPSGFGEFEGNATAKPTGGTGNEGDGDHGNSKKRVAERPCGSCNLNVVVMGRGDGGILPQEEQRSRYIIYDI
jgi:hypothetical protein